MRNFTKEWLIASYDDLLTIEELLDNAHLTHIVAFHSQQCIEKAFKAVLEENEIISPKIHKLHRLHKILPIDVTISNFDILTILDELYIESRYPGDMGLLPNGKPSLEDSREFYEFSKAILLEVCTIFEVSIEEIKPK